jgi:uncharacterized protein YktA (UPF0223 family)
MLDQYKTFKVQIKEKHTREPISEQFVVDAASIYHACDKAEEATGIKVDGIINYIEVEEVPQRRVN